MDWSCCCVVLAERVLTWPIKHWIAFTNTFLLAFASLPDEPRQKLA